MKDIRKEPRRPKASPWRKAGRAGPVTPEGGTKVVIPALGTAAAVGPPAESLERSLRELVRYYRHSAVGRHSQGIIHQMNTPLQVLLFLLEALEQESQDEPKIYAACPGAAAGKLETLRDCRGDKIRQLRSEVGNLQTLTRTLLQQGVHEDQEERIYLDLNDIFRQELSLYLAHPFFKHQVEKEFHLQADLPPIYGHYIDFSQSFRNFVDNALEAMAGTARRKLTVQTAFRDRVRWLRIGDTGVGIPRKQLPLLGQPFFSTKGPDRAGLGLFMARRLLAPYRGEIQVASLPGETWITVSLPVIEEF